MEATLARKSLKKLPQTRAVWEAGMIHATQAQGSATVAGLLVVVERDTGLIRVASAVMAGESPAVLFREAFTAPQSPAVPARPRHVAFDDPWLREQAAKVLDEAGVLSVSTETTAALDDAIARLLQGAGAPVAPGIDADFPAWRAAIQELIRVKPWSALDDGVVFSFSGGGLDGATATVSGHRGELLGVVLRDASRGDAVHLMLEGRTGLSSDERDRCLRVGMQFPPGLYPRVYLVHPGGFGPAGPERSGRLLAAVRAVTALCQKDLTVLAAGGRASVVVDGVTVTSARLAD